MKISTYLIIMGLIAFDYIPKQLFPFMTANNILVIVLFMAIIGPIICKCNKLNLNTFNNRKWVYIIIALFIVSSIYPIVNYGQSVVGTAIALRHNLPILFLLTLLKIEPSEKDIEISLSYLGKLAIVMGCVAIIFPEWFVDSERLQNFNNSEGNDLTLVWPGFHMAVFYFYILIGKLWHSSKYEDLIWASVFMLYILIVQNRSTLICALPFFCIAFIKSNVRFKWIIFTIVLVCVSGYIFTILGDLIEETQLQLGDQNYNRWQAIQFFLIDSSNNLYTFLFGHGIPAKGSGYLYSLLSAQDTKLAYVSDIGMLGTFFYYGICMIIVTYRFILIGVLKKELPIHLRLYSFWMLLVPTIHCFGTLSNCTEILRFVLFFYLIILYSSKERIYGRINNNS